MNSKMTNSQLSTTGPKKQKLSKLEQEQNQRNGHHMEVIIGEGEGDNGAKGTGNKKHNW